jgi:hypothetical protein
MSLSDFTKELSSALVECLQLLDLPPLGRSQILLGSQYLAENNAPPCVVFVPRRNSFGSTVTGSAKPGVSKERLSRRPLWGALQQIEVHCWGSAPDNNPELSFDYTEALRDAILITFQHKLGGASQNPPSWWIDSGDWVDQRDDATKLLKQGHHYMFALTVAIPVTDIPVNFTRPGTTVTIPHPTYAEGN